MKKNMRLGLLITLMAIFILGAYIITDNIEMDRIFIRNIYKLPINLTKYETIAYNEKSKSGEMKNQGDIFLLEKNYDLARNIYEKALDIDKDNGELYISIKNSYMLAGRYDDACDIIRQAICSNIEIDSMNEILEDINNRIGIIFLKKEVYQQEIFMLPEEIYIVVNGQEVKDGIVWKDAVVTDTPGRYMYEGHTEIYHRPINLILNVKGNVYEKKVGYIRNIYMNKDEEVFIDFDEAEFFSGDEARKEAIRDGEIERNREGGCINPCNYYIRNVSYDMVSYKVSRFPRYDLIENEINYGKSGSISLINVDFNMLKAYIDNYKDSEEEEKLLFYIDIKNNQVSSVVRQFLKYN